MDAKDKTSVNIGGRGIFNERLSNIDLCRIVCSIFVIYLHFFPSVRDITNSNDNIIYWVYRFIYSIAIVAVPTFFILSGYCSANSTSQKLGKIINLFVMAIFVSFVQYVALSFNHILNNTFSFSFIEIINSLFVKNYYLYLYSALYVLSPYINKLVKILNKRQLQSLLFIMIILFSCWSTIANYINIVAGGDITSIYFTSRIGTANGFNLINFSMFYLIGVYFKLYYKKNRYNLFLSIALLLIISFIELSIVLLSSITEKIIWNYDSCFVVVSSILFFAVFLNLNINKNRFISYLASCTFGVFLIHSLVDTFVNRLIAKEEIIDNRVLGIFLSIIIFVFGVYILSLIIVFFIKLLGKPINRIFQKTKVYNIRFLGE